MKLSTRQLSIILCLPILIFSLAFLLIPLAKSSLASLQSEAGLGVYLEIITTKRYLVTLFWTVFISASVTIVTMCIATTIGFFLARARFWGRSFLISMLTFPLAFPGVVVGFLIILLGGRQGLLTQILPGNQAFAYSAFGLFLGYLYFSIPRVFLTVMAAIENLDPSIEEAAKTLGAKTYPLMKDILLPAIAPPLIASGAMAFATSMGAFGTAFTLATNIDVLPMVIYSEFTQYANISRAAALSLILGLITWIILLFARRFSGNQVVSGGA